MCSPAPSFGSRVLDKCLDRIGALAQREEEEGGEDSESGPLRRAMGHVTAAMTRDVHAVAAGEAWGMGERMTAGE